MAINITTLNNDAITFKREQVAFLITIESIDPDGGATTDSDWGITSDTIYWSTQKINSAFDSGKWTENIIAKDGLGDINLGFDHSKGGTVGYLGDFSFDIINYPRDSGTNYRFDEYLYANGFYIVNRVVKVYVTTDYTALDGTKTLSDCNLLWSGKVDSFDIDYNIMSCSSSSEGESSITLVMSP